MCMCEQGGAQGHLKGFMWRGRHCDDEHGGGSSCFDLAIRNPRMCDDSNEAQTVTADTRP